MSKPRRSTSPEKSEPSEERKDLMARCAALPEMRNAAVARGFANAVIGDDESELKHTTMVFVEEGKKAADGDLRTVSHVLTSQALTLDAIFTRMAERAAVNMQEYPQAFDRYMQLALKAQANSRATLEALARIHQPREQTVKHVTVHEGGQAVVADHFHAGGKNAGITDQAHAHVAPLPGPDALGNTVPVPGGEGQEEVPNARRGRGKRRTER